MSLRNPIRPGLGVVLATRFVAQRFEFCKGLFDGHGENYTKGGVHAEA